MNAKQRSKKTSCAAGGLLQVRVASGVIEAVDEPGNARQSETIKHLEPALLAGDHARLPQNGKVPRDGGPSQTAGLDQFADALLPAAAQFPDDPDPRRM